MNNILFIGPYRQRDINGIWSNAIIRNILGAGHNIQLRPIYLDPVCSINNIDQILSDKEKTTYNEYNTVVQHVPIEQALPIHPVKNNILIPIVSSKLIDQQQILRLSSFSSILVDNKHTSVKLSESYPILQKSIKNIDYAFSVNSNSAATFDTGVFRTSEKMYMIGNYKHNIRSIKNVVLSFIKNIGSRDITLALFMLDITPIEKTQLINYIAAAYQAMGINYAVNRVIVLPVTSDINNIYTAHKTCDVLIDVVDYGSNTINTKIATSLNKQIIKINPEYTFSFSDDNNQISCEGTLNMSSHEINSSIKRYLKNSILLNNTALFKTQHINNYIK